MNQGGVGIHLIIRRWFDDNMIAINNYRLYNTIGDHNPSGTQYNKWSKDW